MASQSDLDTALGAVETAVQQLGTDVLKAIADLQAKIAAGGTVTDLAPEVARLQAIGTQLASLDTSAVAADQP